MVRSRIVFAALLVLVANGAMAGVIPRPAATGASGRTQVYLLGSQGGQQRTQLTGAGIRSGPSALIVVDGVGYMIDAGVGALLRLNQAGFDANVVRHGVPKLVLYHLVPGTPAISDERWRSLVSPFFAGEIVVGKDLLEL